MKKLLIVLGVVAVFLTATAFVTMQKTETLPGPGDVCKIVGNCTVELKGDKKGNYVVYAENHNNYRVTVEWTAVGYKDGHQRRVGSGTIFLDASGEASCLKHSPTFSTSCEDVSLGDVRVLKCD